MSHDLGQGQGQGCAQLLIVFLRSLLFILSFIPSTFFIKRKSRHAAGFAAACEAYTCSSSFGNNLSRPLSILISFSVFLHLSTLSLWRNETKQVVAEPFYYVSLQHDGQKALLYKTSAGRPAGRCWTTAATAAAAAERCTSLLRDAGCTTRVVVGRPSSSAETRPASRADVPPLLNYLRFMSGDDEQDEFKDRSTTSPATHATNVLLATAMAGFRIYIISSHLIYLTMHSPDC